MVVAPGPATDEQATRLRQHVERLTRYLTPGLTEKLFGDDDINDIQINSDGRIWLDRHSGGRVHEGDVLTWDRTQMFCNSAAQFLGTTFDARNSILEGELPGPTFLGSRLIAFGPPTASYPALVVRKPPLRVFRLAEYVETGILTPPQHAVLVDAVEKGRNLLICGATRSGKTTFMNAVLAEVAERCPSERALIVEDTLEVKSTIPNSQVLRTSQHKDHEALLKGILRASPDRIIFGEVRDKTVLTLLDAWSTGHIGCMATFHASDPQGALWRCNRLMMRNRVPPDPELIASAVHVLVMIRGGSVRRHVGEIVEIVGINRNERRFELNRLA